MISGSASVGRGGTPRSFPLFGGQEGRIRSKGSRLRAQMSGLAAHTEVHMQWLKLVAPYLPFRGSSQGIQAVLEVRPVVRVPSRKQRQSKTFSKPQVHFAGPSLSSSVAPRLFGQRCWRCSFYRQAHCCYTSGSITKGGENSALQATHRLGTLER